MLTDIKQLLPTSDYQAIRDILSLRTPASAANPFATLADLIGGGSVTSVSGTLNRITSTGGATPVIDIDVAYVGQASITTVGTLTSGATGIGFTIALAASTVTGVLPIANGGTNSGAALANDRMMISSAGAIIEHTAQTPTLVSFYDANGLPFGDSNFFWNNTTKRLFLGTPGATISSRLVINTTTFAERAILGFSDYTTAVFSSSVASASTEATIIQKTGVTTVPVDMLALRNVGHVSTVGAGQYIRFDEVIASGPVAIGKFGMIVTDTAIGTFKSAFVWLTPNETTGVLVERMRLTSAGILNLGGLAGVGTRAVAANAAGDLVIGTGTFISPTNIDFTVCIPVINVTTINGCSPLLLNPVDDQQVKIGPAVVNPTGNGVLRISQGTAIIDIGEEAAGVAAIWLNVASPGATTYTLKKSTTGITTLNSAATLNLSIADVIQVAITSTTHTINNNLVVNGSISAIAGSVSLAYTPVTGTYTVLATDYTIDATSGTFVVTLPTAVGITGRIYIIKNSGSGAITLAGNAGQTFDGTVSPVILAGNSLMIQSNNVNWTIIG